MKLVVVRHAVAEDRDRFARTGRHDAERPLTTAGREKMVQGAMGLARWIKHIDTLAASPCVRARQTAELLAERYGNLKVELWPELSPGRAPVALSSRLREG